MHAPWSVVCICHFFTTKRSGGNGQPGHSRGMRNQASPALTASWLAIAAAGVASCATPPPDEDGVYQPGDGDGDGDGDPQNPDPDPGRCAADRAEPALPFGSHTLPYAEGSIVPSGEQAALDDAVRSIYDQWKGTYIEEGCGEDRAYVAANTEENKRTVSEAHGYGMLILAYMAGHDPDARRLFDAMYRYYRDHPAGGALMAWAQGHNCENVDGASSATDGDLDIAYALLLADKQWGSGGEIDYFSVALDIIDAIWEREVDPSGSWLLLGSWGGSGKYADSTRSSDFMPDHLWAFAEASGEDRWTTLSDREYAMVKSLQENHAPVTGLLPDFVLSPDSDPRPADPEFLETQYDGTYSWNACRDPFRLGVHFLTTGDARAKEALARINSWAIESTGGDPGRLRAGYMLDGAATRDFSGMAFNGPFAVGAMVDANNQAWLDGIWAQTGGLEGDYYNNTLQLLTMIALSGNWWSPAAADCAE
jgi:endo-1,4-beta-D-glucanase Y